MNVAKIKDAVRARDGFRCALCSLTNEQHVGLTGKQLEVHRVIPGSAYSAEPGACVTLCRSCHGPQPRSPRGTYPNGQSVKLPADLLWRMRVIYSVKKYRKQLPPRSTFPAFLNSFILAVIDADYRRVCDAMMLATPSTD